MGCSTLYCIHYGTVPLVLDGDPFHFLFVLAILHKIGAGIFVFGWLLWIWHMSVVLLLNL